MLKRINQVLWYARLGCSTAAPTAQHVVPPQPWAGGLTVHNIQAALAKAFHVILVRHIKIHWGEVFFDDAAQHYTASTDITPALPVRGE